jgi:hypothetical protein
MFETRVEHVATLYVTGSSSCTGQNIIGFLEEVGMWKPEIIGEEAPKLHAWQGPRPKPHLP